MATIKYFSPSSGSCLNILGTKLSPQKGAQFFTTSQSQNFKDHTVTRTLIVPTTHSAWLPCPYCCIQCWYSLPVSSWFVQCYMHHIVTDDQVRNQIRDVLGNERGKYYVWKNEVQIRTWRDRFPLWYCTVRVQTARLLLLGCECVYYAAGCGLILVQVTIISPLRLRGNDVAFSMNDSYSCLCLSKGEVAKLAQAGFRDTSWPTLVRGSYSERVTIIKRCIY
jgi:hypothetical protein